jgi:hypothetical protein
MLNGPGALRLAISSGYAGYLDFGYDIWLTDFFYKTPEVAKSLKLSASRALFVTVIIIWAC